MTHMTLKIQIQVNLFARKELLRQSGKPFIFPKILISLNYHDHDAMLALTRTQTVMYLMNPTLCVFAF